MAAKRRFVSPYVKPRASDSQKAALDAVRELTRQHGRSPTATEVGERLGMTRQGAAQLLHLLERKGLLRDIPKMISSGQWELTEAGVGQLPK